jgi:hypothetical protein
MNSLRLAAAVVLVTSGVAQAEPPPGVKVLRVELHPAAAPSPVLRYALLPDLRQQKPGNAVPPYRKAVKSLKEAAASLNDPEWQQRLEKWRQLPLERLPRESVRAFFRAFDGALSEFEESVRHEYADWELADKLRKMGIGTTLPDVQEIRNFAALLSVRARLAMADGRIDDAVRDLQTILAGARHLNQGPTLITALVGVAIASVAAQQIDTLVQQPAAPNLYWSLTDLPQPFIDLRAGFDGERISAYGTFPGLPASPRAEIKPMTPEQLNTLWGTVTALRRQEVPIPDGPYKVVVALDLLQKHEKAKAALVEAGWPRDQIDKMPHIEVGILHGLLDYERWLDESVKWNNFPYWQAAPAQMEMEKRLARRYLPGNDDSAVPLARMLVPASGRVLFSRTRLERKLAALRCVEAIRLYAAGHDGKLPASLDAIREVPIPVDPYTGKPFEYRRDGDQATLFAPAIAPPVVGRPANPQEALYYEIAMKR